MFLTCLEGPRGKLFPPENDDKVDQTIWADRTPDGVVNIEAIQDTHTMVTTTLNLVILLPDSERETVLQYDCLDQQRKHQNGSYIQMGAASWKTSKKKLVLDFLTAFRLTVDHCLLQRSPGRLDRHIGDLNLWERLGK